jgi:hypothetical protein
MGEWKERAGREITLRAGQRDTLLKSVGLALPATLIAYTRDAQAVSDTETNADTPCYAIITCGAGGVAFSVEVDLSRGCVVTVPAGEVSVAAVYEIDPQAPSPVQPDQCVGVVIVDGAHPGSNQPTRTRRIHGLLNGATGSVRVPPRAINVAILTSDVTAYGADLRLHLWRAPAGRLLSTLRVSGPAPVALPNGIRAVAIENRVGVTLSVALVFGLAL